MILQYELAMLKIVVDLSYIILIRDFSMPLEFHTYAEQLSKLRMYVLQPNCRSLRPNFTASEMHAEIANKPFTDCS